MDYIISDKAKKVTLGLAVVGLLLLVIGFSQQKDFVYAKKGNIFSAYIDGDHLDDYISVAKAEKGIKDFIRLAGK